VVLRVLRGKKFFFPFLLFALLACEQPFKAGLGPVVDVRPPTVSLDTPNAGEYLWGTKVFKGVAEDDYKLDRVQLRVSNNPDVEYLREYDFSKIPLARNSGGRDFSWQLEIDTTQFPDGDFKIRIRAVDSMNKITELDEIAFYVKNNPPAITVAAPLILRGEEPGEVGGPHLNYYKDGEPTDVLPPSISYPRQMDKGSFLSGTISDDEDIYLGAADAANNRYPPQIRFWLVNDGRDPENTGGYPPGVLPPADEAPWQNFVKDQDLFMLGLGNYQFVYNLPDETNRYYGFEIRAQNKDGRSHFHYPRDFYTPDINWDDLTTNAEFKKENRYVLVYLRSPKEVPTAELYGLEDILGPNGWNAQNNKYRTLKDADGNDLDDNQGHPYVNRAAVNKSNSFTLRVKTVHSEGISTAEVYWEKEDRSARGRFIWDLADESPFDGWQDANNVKPDLPYSYWGYRDPHSMEDGFYTARSFIFSYDPRGEYSIPDGSGYHAQVRGHSKIQAYKGSDDEWKKGKAGGLWPLAEKFDNNLWEDVYNRLSDGVYNIEVYTRSQYGTAMTTPLTCAVRLDSRAPVIDLTGIEGVYSQDGTSQYTVNGVVRPQFLFSDSRSEDSGARIGTDEYFKRGSVYGYDQFFVLIDESKAGAMQKIIADGKWWPITKQAKPGRLTADGIDDHNGGVIRVYADGPVVNSALKVKTSGIYNTWNGDTLIEDLNETDKLPNGKYQLYVFCRDNAFNVGNTWLTLNVQKETDRPQFDFSVSQISEGVTNPNADNADDGFTDTSGNKRNILGPNSNIRLKITDDDGLDLGQGASSDAGYRPSGIKISFTGSYTDSSGVILPYTGPGYVMDLSDAQVKAIFQPQLSIKESTGTIRQSVLLELLQGNNNYNYLFDEVVGKTNYRSLPEGIYRVSISIRDYSPAKLTLDGENPAKIADNSVAFWLAVDTTAPVIELAPPPLVPESNSFIADKVNFVGTVTDRNGPVTIKSFYVTDQYENMISDYFGSQDPDAVLTVEKDVTRQDTPAEEKWAGDFDVQLSLPHETSGTYVITLELQDRFGNSAKVTKSYIVDSTPPTVDLRKKMDTFARDEDGKDENGFTITTSEGIDEIKNKTRLANGVLSFIINAADNYKVHAARWWLLPAISGPYSFSGFKDKYDLEEIGEFLTYDPVGFTTNTKSDILTEDFSSTSFYIDTATLTDDREYDLYVVAMDTAGNVSDKASMILQRIYVLQEQDKPYFGVITPNGTVEGDSGAVIRGIIYEDDGFVVGDSSVDLDTGNISGIEAGTVKVRMNTSGTFADSDPWTTIDANTANYIVQGKNISLRVNLIKYFPAMFSTQGEKYYQIQMTDSWYGKYIDEDGHLADDTNGRVSGTNNKKVYSFTYDTIDPVIEVTHPGSGTSFGPGSTSGTTPNVSLYLTGSIADANLATMKDYYGDDNYNGANKDNFYFRYWLDADIEHIKVYECPGPGTSVNFNIAADTFTNLINFDGLEAGSHTLFLEVKDKSGKTGSASLPFIKDTDPPDFDFTTFDMDKAITLNDLPAPASSYNAAWYTANYNANKAVLNALPIIQYNKDNNEVPYIEGTFDDEISNIDNATFYFSFDGDTPVSGAAAIVSSGKNVSWRVYLTSNGATSGTVLADGIHSIQLCVKDTVGNERYGDFSNDPYPPTTLNGPRFGFRLNSILPQVAADTVNGSPIGPAKMVLGDSGSGSGSDIILTVTGTAWSPNIKNVTVSIRYTDRTGTQPVDGSAVLGTWTFADSISPVTVMETIPWSINITRTMLVNAAGEPTLEKSSGNYVLIAQSVDLSDIPSNEYEWAFVIDAKKPEFTFDLNASPDTNRTPQSWTVSEGGSWKNNANFLGGDTPHIRGGISDGESNLTAAWYTIERYNYVNSRWEFYNFGSSVWTAASGDYWKNLSPPSSTNYPLDLVLKTEIPTFSDGYYRVQLRAKDSSLKNGGDASWNATGNGNPTRSDYVYFFYAADDITLANSPLNPPNPDPTVYSSRVKSGNNLSFKVSAHSVNRFHRLVVNVTPVGATKGTPVLASIDSPAPLSGSGSDTWQPTVDITFNPAVCGDGAYQITYTVYDLAGLEKTVNRTITLDNAAPTARIDTPQHLASPSLQTTYPYAGRIANGGEDFAIKGITEDIGLNGSASGVKSMWYHLGYIGNGANDSSLIFPTEAQIITSWGTPTAANAWFEYADSATVPRGFTAISGSDVRNWELLLPSKDGNDIKDYATASFAVGGTTYNVNGGLWLTQRVRNLPPDAPDEYKKAGLYSMPLWVRVEDTVGNVSYWPRDIWIYPNGDNPSGVITNPQDDSVGASDNPRGGIINIEGVASDNKSIRSVIYRVWADAQRGEVPPNASSVMITPLQGGTPIGAAERNVLTTKYSSLSHLPQGGMNNWFRASLEDMNGPPATGWSFIINRYDEIADRIQDKGFAWSGSGANDTIRVYVEVFVFDGVDEGAGIGSGGYNADNVISLGDSEDTSQPKPYVRMFYLNKSAPKISNYQISAKGDHTKFGPYNTGGLDTANDNKPFVRSGKFAIQAELDSGAPQNTISQISVRMSDGKGWQSVYGGSPLVGTANGATVAWTNGQQKGTLTYQFDSAILTSGGGFGSVKDGQYRNTGGRFTIDVRIRDNNSPPAEDTYQFEVGVDNFVPVADEVKNVTNTKVAGSDVAFTGRVFDYYFTRDLPRPEYSGGATSKRYRSVDRIYAWFTKNQNGTADYVSMTGGKGSPSTLTMAAYVGRSATVNYVPGTENVQQIGGAFDPITPNNINPGTLNDTFPYPNPGSGVGTEWVKVLSNETSSTLANRITFQPRDNTEDNDILWSFITDTTVMPDGWIYLNYLVVDSAGNAAFYQQKMVVMNKYPKITDVTLYTNNTGTGAIFTTHEGAVAESTWKVNYDDAKNVTGYSTIEDPALGNLNLDSKLGYLNSGFYSKNNVIGFGVNVMSDRDNNLPLNYRLQYVKREKVMLTASNLTAMAGKTGDFATTAVTGYENLFTIPDNDKTQIDRYTWALLGANSEKPGTHFVFTAKAADVTALTGYGDEYVWGYRKVANDLAISRTGRTGAQAYNVPVAEFNFTGADFFGAARIAEALGSQPENGVADDTKTAFFLIKVWDTVIPDANMVDKGVTRPVTEDDQLYDAIVIGMNVYVGDKNPPKSRLYDLNPYAETAVSLNGAAQTLNDAADPTAIGKNILRGGLYNKGTEQAPIKSGYIDPRNDSTALRPWLRDSFSQQWQRVDADGFVSADSAAGILADSSANTANRPTFDKVSGAVILRGIAWDDQLIDTISIYIGTGTTTGTGTVIARLENDPTDTNPNPDLRRKIMRPVNPDTTWVKEEINWKTGHTVEWAYLWNTETNFSTPTQDVRIRTFVKDKNGSSGAGLPSTAVKLSAQTIADVTENESPPTPNSTAPLQAAEQFHNVVAVDIVPYITGFERQEKYTTKRSLQGWYSFYQGETNVAVLGYNFGAGSTMTVAGTTGIATTGTISRREFTIPAAGASGLINLTVTSGTVTAYNHTPTAASYTSKSWNRESSAFTKGSDLWINRPHAHIWRTSDSNNAPRTYMGSITVSATSGSQGLDHPGMALEYTGTNAGRLHGTWAVYGYTTVYYGANDGNNNRMVYQLDNNNNQVIPGDPYATPDISIVNGGGAAAANVGFSYQGDGRDTLLLKAVVGTPTNIPGPANDTDGSNIHTIQAPSAGHPTLRWQNVRISKALANSNNSEVNVGKIYMTAYDARNNSLWYGSRDTTGTATNRTMFIDGGNASITQATGTLASVGSAGQYSAVDYDDTGPIIAYYDQTNDTVRVALGPVTDMQAAPGTAANRWSRINLLPSSHKLFRGSGKYISIKVDRLNGIHLAFYNSVYNKVVYYYAADRTYIANGTVPNNSTVKCFTIDNGITGGTWTDISVRDNNTAGAGAQILPWIVYGDSSRTGNYDGVRVAYLSDTSTTNNTTGVPFNGSLLTQCPVTGVELKNWEALTMPADFKVNNDRLNIEAWPPTVRGNGVTLGTRPTAETNTFNWAAAIGYASDMYRIGYFAYPGSKNY
jgi:hypothetical protein